MDINKILFIAQEVSPYVPDSGLARLGHELPQLLQQPGVEVRIFTPKYGIIKERLNQLHEVKRLSGINIVINDADHPLIMKVATMQPSKLSVYFIYNDDYFAHVPVRELETVTGVADNDERSIFFVRAVIESVRKQRWNPMIIHCAGWITALAPVYMRLLHTDDPSFCDAKIVYTLHADDFVEPLQASIVSKMVQDGIPADMLADLADNPVDYLALTRLALQHSDGVMVCSEQVRPEVAALVEQCGLPVLPYDRINRPDATPDARRQIIGDFYASL